MAIRLAILGATGMAGREAARHQEFLDTIGQYAVTTCLTASPGSKGRKYGAVYAEKENTLKESYGFWQPAKCPESLADLVLDETDPEIIAKKANYAISALNKDIAEKVEPELLKLGVNVFSNASAFRWAKNVPLLIPEVNYRDLQLIEKQASRGKLVCNPNCTTAGYTPVINVLMRHYSIKSITLVTQQALSGKGDAIANPEYVRSIVGNVKDDWTKDNYNSEEWKSACEPMKILGIVRTKEKVEAERKKVFKGRQSCIIPIYTQTTRVPTQYGHLEYVQIVFSYTVNVDEIKRKLKCHNLPAKVKNLPTTPKHLFHILDRMPSPKEDVYADNGMAIVLGDFQQHTPRIISFFSLTHNLRRGATWAGRQGLELYLQKYQGMFQ